MTFAIALALLQATPYDGGDFTYHEGRCSELVYSGAIHWGIDKATCHELARLDANLNRS